MADFLMFFLSDYLNCFANRSNFFVKCLSQVDVGMSTALA